MFLIPILIPSNYLIKKETVGVKCSCLVYHRTSIGLRVRQVLFIDHTCTHIVHCVCLNVTVSKHLHVQYYHLVVVHLYNTNRHRLFCALILNMNIYVTHAYFFNSSLIVYTTVLLDIMAKVFKYIKINASLI